MSGFAGMISLDGAPPDRQLLEKMAARLAFRGPDGTHIRTQPGAGFCFTFLRTGPAPQCPSQPCTLDGRTWLLGDIRLDGRDDVRLKLEQHGEELSADVTDEELILRTWQLWGEEGISELIGDYAFALWDAEARQLRCWRDPMGSKPFFYAQAGGWLYFSNTLDAIRCAPGISRDLDHHFIGDFLLQGWCAYPGRTAFRDVSRLSPGHRLHHSGAHSSVERSFVLPLENAIRLKHHEEYVEQFRFLLALAVRERMPLGPLAVFMSGGLDSTSVAALAVENAKQQGIEPNIRAVTVDWRRLFDDDEGWLASRAAKFLRIPISLTLAGSEKPFVGWNTAREFLPEPSHDPYRSLLLKGFRQANEHARIAFNGYGGDGILTGQSWPYLRYLWSRSELATIGREFGGYILRFGKIPPLRGGFRARLRSLLILQDPMDEYPPWLVRGFQNETALSQRWMELQNSPKGEHPWYPNAFRVLSTGAWAGTLEGEDPAWHGVPVESRSPFLDLRVQRFLLRVPPVPLCIDKELLRRSMHGSLPEEILRRPKTPLRFDPISTQKENGSWSPLPLPQPSHNVSHFIDWQVLSQSLESESGASLWRNLRPVSLLYWLSGGCEPAQLNGESA